MTKVLVTGADGFIGSHLTEMLVKEGSDVRALVQYNSFGSYGWLDQSSISKDVEVVMGDVRDSGFCENVTKQVDVVFNLAALIAIPFSYVAPSSYVETNINGTLNICQACLNNGVGKLVQISTSEVYGTAQYVPIDEKHPLQAQSPYSATKIASDALARSFFTSFDLPVIIARPFNTYGPRQSARAVIPTIITQIASGFSSIKLGDLTPTRDLSFVEDTCIALQLLASKETLLGEVVNIGSNFEISIHDLVKTIQNLMQKEIVVISDSQRIRPEKSEVSRLWCDNSKLVELTGFAPRYNLIEGMEKTIDWFSQEKNLSQYKHENYNI